MLQWERVEGNNWKLRMRKKAREMKIKKQLKEISKFEGLRSHMTPAG